MKTIIAAALAILTPEVLDAATLIGDTVQIRRELPSANLVFGPFSTIVEAGFEDSVNLSTGNNLSVNLEADRIIFNFGPNPGDGGGFSDHRIVISDIDWFGEPSLTLESIRVTSDLAGFSPSFVTFTDDTVSMEIGSLFWPGGQTVVVELAPTPEPAAGVFLLLGLGSVLCKRRQQTPSTVRCGAADSSSQP